MKTELQREQDYLQYVYDLLLDNEVELSQLLNQYETDGRAKMSA